jgi:imidazole glycerol-phosphate synthase subunit HisH
MAYKNLKIGIIDYGVGNYTSLLTSLKKLDYSLILSNEEKLLSKCDILILPGVGSFHEAIKKLSRYKLINFIKSWASSNKPIIGICLGMQLLGDYGFEGGKKRGLGIIPGVVRSLINQKWHIGWNEIVIKKFEKIQPICKDFYYFNHSFIFETKDEFIHATASFDETIPAIIGKDKIVGFQFHPEKSHKQGLELMAFFIEKLSNE